MIDILKRLKFDAVRCEAQFSKGVAINISEGVDEIERLRAALAICGADFSTKPGTVMSAAQEINREFQRRMQVAADALSHEQNQDEGP